MKAAQVIQGHSVECSSGAATNLAASMVNAEVDPWVDNGEDSGKDPGEDIMIPFKSELTFLAATPQRAEPRTTLPRPTFSPLPHTY